MDTKYQRNLDPVTKAADKPKGEYLKGAGITNSDKWTNGRVTNNPETKKAY